MTVMSDLPGDLIEEILSRVRLTSLRRVQSTCKTWNALSKNLILGQKAVKKQFMAFMVKNYRICLLRFELQGIRNKDYDYKDDLADPFLKQMSIPHHHQVKISQVFHCDGLLLCVLEDTSKLLVWNPYLGQTRWLLPRPLNSFHRTVDTFAIGYDDDNNKRNHKILRFSICYIEGGRTYMARMDVFDFRSASWRVLDVNSTPNWSKQFCFPRGCVSLKGNTYYCVNEKRENYLLCFDFTIERFGPLLHLPQPQTYPLCFLNVIPLKVRDEKLALLYSDYKTSETIVIWITTKIEPNAVSWTKFLTLDMKHHDILLDAFWIHCNRRSLFIDEEKKVAVFFDIVPRTGRCQMAYIIGEDGYFRSVNIGEARSSATESLDQVFRVVCSCYVPSLVQLQV